MPSTRNREAKVFAALGDETRLWLVARLSDTGPMSITRLTEGSRMSRQAVTKHLAVMKGARLVSCRKRGRERIWELDRDRLQTARQYLDQISAQWDQALERLEAFVTADPVSSN